ncbi:MAG TPA: hypothetical protein PLL19_04775 [Thiobacillaceae bacterium]|nr:hypothetical protein [Thiobacillaceae bacterium]HNF88623.1 hypothetical protein [Thiobacillaceae bacterium]HNH87896.1 hypothetical protein [Thiobacillaceae bacterium]HNI08728.1 hypothetical protein [Thiobacillaceae bacterium]
MPPELRGVPLPAWAEWLAQDGDGTWWAYEAEPNQQPHGWYENEVGRIGRLVLGPPPADWRECLIRMAR